MEVCWQWRGATGQHFDCTVWWPGMPRGLPCPARGSPLSPKPHDAAPRPDSICAIRQREVRYSKPMAQINGLNMALQFLMAPLAAFATFSVHVALGGTLSIASVFYVLSLLSLPQVRPSAARRGSSLRVSAGVRVEAVEPSPATWPLAPPVRLRLLGLAGSGLDLGRTSLSP